jgi:cyclopropane fatty-acyl-phospholipid synthase-like methyltransferase
MPQSIPERLTWAVEILAVHPSDHLLEIGCGQGAAVTLIAEKLADGKITAIDRSQKMIDAATEKNQAYVQSGKAVFQTTAVDEADFGGERFHKIFAINVNVFWTETAAAELAVIEKSLRPDGVLYLFYQPPSADKIQGIIDQVSANLEAHHFAVKQVIVEKSKPVRSVCIVAEINPHPKSLSLKARDFKD